MSIPDISRVGSKVGLNEAEGATTDVAVAVAADKLRR